MTQPSGYTYDIFVSYPRGGNVERFVREVFLPQLRKALFDQHPHEDPRVFVDEVGVAVGENISDSIRAALRGSKLLLAILNPLYAKKMGTAKAGADRRDRRLHAPCGARLAERRT